MRVVEGSILIERPVEEVFDFVADERNEPRYNRRMRRADLVSAGPVGAGSHFRAELGGLRRPIELDIELTGYERPRLLASSSHTAALDTRGALTFEALPEGTRLSWRWELEPHPPWSMLGALVVPVGRAQEQRVWQALKELLEEGTPGAGVRAAGEGAVQGAVRPEAAARSMATARRRRVLSVCAGAVAASACAGAIRFATGRNDPRLAPLRAELPFRSTVLAASALVAVVAVPFSALSALAWRGNRRADPAAVGAGGLLLGWLAAQRALIRQRSWLQPLYGGIALCFVAAGSGDLRRRVQRWAVARRRPAGTGPSLPDDVEHRPWAGPDEGS